MPSGELFRDGDRWKVRPAEGGKARNVSDKALVGSLADLTLEKFAELKGDSAEFVVVEYEYRNGSFRDVRQPGEELSRPRPAAVNQGADTEGDAGAAQRPEHVELDAPPAEGSFLNPYGFVPWVDRRRLPAELQDKAPVGHDRLQDDLWSGTIDLKVRAVTPLLLLEPERMTLDSERHRTIPVARDEHGRPHLSPTGLKGSLRSAFEAITGSRMGVFSSKEHSERLAFRMEPRDGLNSVPARVTDDGQQIQLLLGLSALGTQPQGKVHAAWLPAYRSPGERPTLNGRPIDADSHGKSYWATIELIRVATGRNIEPEYWRVRQISETRDGLEHLEVPPPSQVQRSHSPVQGVPMRHVNGYVFWTNRNFEKKHDERFFFHDGDPTFVPLSDELCQTWSDLIRSYRSAHEGSLDRGRGNHRKDEYLGAKPGQTAWSPHQYDKTRQGLHRGGVRDGLAGQLLYVLFQGRNPVGLLPVSIARRTFAQPPWKQLPEFVRPASALGELSAADRVFGWINPSGSGSHRGQLRVVETSCVTPPGDAVRKFEDGLTLAVLSQPKPQQGRFYLSHATRQPGNAQLGGSLDGVVPAETYTKDTAVKGWKRYWHHADTTGSWPDPGTPAATRYQRNNKDDQNITVQGWVKPGTVFRATIEVKNLTQIELGALLWLFQLPEGAHHRLGYGKPLGFGSVRVEIEDQNLFIGEEWNKFWTNLQAVSPQPQPEELESCRAAFEEAIQRNDGLGRAVEAFLVMAKGVDEVPVLYPRMADQLEGNDELYRWFVENGKTQMLGLRDVTDPYLQILG